MTQQITSGDRSLSLDNYRRLGAQAATGFAELGMREGDVVALLMRNDIAMLVAMQGAIQLGCYCVPINWHYTTEEVDYILRDSEPKVLLAHADLLPQIGDDLPGGIELLVAETPPEIGQAYWVSRERYAVPDGFTKWDGWLAQWEPREAPPALDRGSMIYTSGTTGRPKGVRREPSTTEQKERTLKRACDGFGLEPGSKVLMNGPMYHSAPAAYARTALHIECDVHLMPRFDAEELLRLIDEYGFSHMHMVPTMFVRLMALPEEVKAKYDVSSLASVIHGAAPCPPEVKRGMIAWWGPVIREYYGSTEAGLVTIASSDEWLAKPGTVGPATPDTEVRIYDGEGNVLPANTEGEIYMRTSDMTDFTYHKRDDDRRDIERDGFLTNGDVGYLDDEGFLFLCDRKRDMVISGGVNIYPAEIESVLINAPGIADCAVFGIPDDQFGEVVAAAVTTHAGQAPSEDEIKDYLGQYLAGFKLPRLIAFHDSLPREDSGKIFKRKLREPYWRDAGRRI